MNESAAQLFLLLGMRGSGKSTVGRLLAEHLQRPFIDLDDRALARFAEPSIRAVWEAHGEESWRRAEVESLHEVVAADDPVVIALGGGTAMIPTARHLIEAARHSGRANVIHLRADADVLAARIRADRGDRPSLTGSDVVEEIAQVLDQRSATYAALSDFTVDAASEPDAIAALIIEWIDSRHA